jgi:hypothetical protein
MRSSRSTGAEHEALTRVPLDALVRRLERARRAATVWGLATAAFGALLWLWLRAPSFNLLPGAIRAVLSVISVLGYGILGLSGSSVSNVADYVNIGYGIIAGPIILCFVALAWSRRERYQAEILNALVAHAELRNLSASRLRVQPEGKIGFCITAILILGSSIVAINRYFDLRAFEGDFDCANEKVAACRPHENLWAAPWQYAGDSRLSWLRLEINNWCVSAPQSWLPTFRAVLPDGYFTSQLRVRYQCAPEQTAGPPAKIIRPKSADETDATTISSVTLADLHKLLNSASSADPYKQFPYAIPLVNLPMWILSLFAQLWIIYLIFKERCYQLRLRTRSKLAARAVRRGWNNTVGKHFRGEES